MFSNKLLNKMKISEIIISFDQTHEKLIRKKKSKTSILEEQVIKLCTII